MRGSAKRNGAGADGETWNESQERPAPKFHHDFAQLTSYRQTDRPKTKLKLKLESRVYRISYSNTNPCCLTVCV